jgi:hypothetical protein
MIVPGITSLLRRVTGHELTPLTAELIDRFAVARAAGTLLRTTYQDFLDHCPSCGPGAAVNVVSLRGADGQTHNGHWPLTPRGFAWGYDRNGVGGSSEEVTECSRCRLCRPLSDYRLDGPGV